MDEVTFNATGNRSDDGQAVPGSRGRPHHERHPTMSAPSSTATCSSSRRCSPMRTFGEPRLASEWAAVQEQLDSPATQHVVIDLGEIPYFGSTVLEWMAQFGSA